MKFVLFALMLGQFWDTPKKVFRGPQSLQYVPDCDSVQVASKVRQGKLVPRNVLYHYGKRDVLLKNAQIGTISEHDWNVFIMGNETRYRLKKFRRGLYGTEKIEDADRFASGTYNWAMEIQIKQECLKPEKVVSLVYLTQSNKFKKWFKQQSFPISFSEFSESCFSAQGLPKNSCFEYYSGDRSERTPEKIVADYFFEQGFTLVQDHVGDLSRSWALIDRSCIKKIEASDEFWVNAFTKKSDLWVNSCNPGRNHRNNIRVWFAAIKNSGITAEQLSGFSEMIKSTEAPSDVFDRALGDMDRFVVQDFVDEMIIAFDRCGVNRKSEFNKALDDVVQNIDLLMSNEVKAKWENTCR